MAVELQNTTHDPLCAEIVLYPDTGLTYAATWSGAIASYAMNVPAFGSAKTVVPAGTQVNGVTRGTMRIGACAGSPDFAPGSVHVATYASSPAGGSLLYFFPSEANSGAAANSW